MAKSEDVGIKELPHWLYEPMIKKHGSRIKEELQGIIENRCQENIIQHHVHLTQLVENGMPYPTVRGKKKRRKAQCYQSFAADKRRRRSQWNLCTLQERNHVEIKNSELLYIQ